MSKNWRDRPSVGRSSSRPADLTRTLTTAGRTLSTTSAKLTGWTPWTWTASASAGVVWVGQDRAADDSAAEDEGKRGAEKSARPDLLRARLVRI